MHLWNVQGEDPLNLDHNLANSLELEREEDKTQPGRGKKNLSTFLDQICCVARLVYDVLVLGGNIFPLQEVHQIANQSKVDLLNLRRLSNSPTSPSGKKHTTVI